MTRNVVVPEADRVAYERFHFAQGVRHGDLLICSGQIGVDSNGSAPEAAEEEFRLAWRAVGRVLVEAGMGFENVLEYTTFHVGLAQHLRAFMSVRDEFLEAPWPAWTAIGVSELAVPGARVEIRVTAAAPAG
ncbi:MAG: RidA family protein [Pseudomonadales bacterium]